MKRILQVLCLCIASTVLAQQQNVSYDVSPSSFEEDEMITLTFDGSSFDESLWGVNNNALYLWAWSFDINDTNGMDSPTNGAWTNSNEANRLTYDMSSDSYSISFVPTTFYNRTGIGKIGFLIKALDGTGDKKSQDILVEVGSFQISLTSPNEDSTTIINSGDNVSVSASNTNGNANYNLLANGVSINTSNDASSYIYNITNITENTTYDLEVTQSGTTITKSFSVIINPGANTQAIPSGLSNGINYDDSDATKATLVLEAPGKDFIYAVGSFNNWQPSLTDAMKKDPSSSKYWIELTGLTSGQIETYQYWVFDTSPLSGSSNIVKTADPLSTLVLDNNHDGFIPESTYPNLPDYPAGQSGTVSVLQTGQTSFAWQANAFTKPDQENLVVYEMLIRDFTTSDTFAEAITRLDYLEVLGINAIELMPVSEFEGNDSWGYNVSHHNALDKAYGTIDSFKTFVDECHQRGIAVILDVVYNHAFSQSPIAQLYWDNDNFRPATDNPYLNVNARHPFNVGFDFNHESTFTRDYVKQTLRYWVEEFRIDGFRFDLSKGFTQTNNPNNIGAWNAFDASRIAILQDYANDVWSYASDTYLILEHFADNSEETVLANFGFLLWGNIHGNFKQNMLGFPSDALGNTDISGLAYTNRGWNDPHLVGYMESHDEERLIVESLNFGNSSGSYDASDLETAFDRLEAATVIFYSVPGPKMLWQFGELGYDFSINYCPDGSINSDCRTGRKPIAWDLGYDSNTGRNDVNAITSVMANLKTNNPSIFNTTDFQLNINGLVKRINLNDDVGNEDVVVLANFAVTAQSVNPNFPATGLWYDVFTGDSINVTNVSAPINLQPGEYRLFSQNQTLSTDENRIDINAQIFPNPVNDIFQINTQVSKVDIYDLTGKQVRSFNGDFSYTHRFNISNLNTGIYITKIEDSNGQSMTAKLVKL